jgi:hypothetical protein
MFDLEKSIADWRRQMLAAGIKTPVPLDELESHLREDVENQMRSGLSAQPAFETTVQQIGQSDVLKNEFAKVGGAKVAQAKHFVLTLAGIPNQYLDTDMNTSNIEPRWATYLKSAAFLFPAVGLWILNMVFIFPKCQDICNAAKVNIPAWLQTAIALANILKNNFLLICVSLIIVLVLLEWRVRQWPRYRRAIFGVLAFLLNLAVLLWITTLLVLSLVAVPNLVHQAH